MKTIFIRFNLLVAVLIFTVVCLFGQNYKTVHFGREAYFESESFDIGLNGYSYCSPCLFGIRVDTILSDSINYKFPDYFFADLINDDLQPRGSWLGPNLEFLIDGTELFYNKNNKEITIMPQASLQENWSVFSLPNNGYLEGKITDISYVEILGQMDSIKTITLQAKDANGVNIDHLMNGTSIQIAKHLGFVKTLDLFYFPDENKPVNLVGLSNPDLGQGLLNARSIFNFSVGDEFHYLDDVGIFYEDDDSLFTKLIVLEREDVNIDSVAYTIDQHIVRKNIFYDPIAESTTNSFTEERDTLIQAYNLANNDFYDLHPYEGGWSNQILFTSYISKNADGEWFKEINSGAPNSSISWYSHYQNGIGKTYDHLIESPQLLVSERLIYYKKGNTEWGTPVDFVALTSTKQIQDPKTSILIYPNPSKENITIHSKDSNIELQHIQVVNTLGQKVADWPCDNQLQISKSVVDFPRGIYWLLVTDANENIWRLSFTKG